MTASATQQFVHDVQSCTARLRLLDQRRVVFGSGKHDYSFAPVLGAEQVLAFEQRHSIVLPAEYRAFITQVGNGGAGPFYGVLPMSLESPQITQPWTYDTRHEVVADEEFDTDPPGAITIAEYGCGIFVLLIVNGHRAGEIWWDARYETGFDPIEQTDGTRLRFDNWWLGIMNGHLSRLERVRALMNARTPHEEIHQQLDGPILQLEVDQMMASLINVELSGTPKVIPDKPWGLRCGQLDEHYERWLATGKTIAETLS
jgi:hypothetical protein